MKNNKKKSITIRITENQYKRLIDTVIEEEINKSQFIRESIKYQISKIKRKSEIENIEDFLHQTPIS